MTVKNFLNACQSAINTIEIRQIREDIHTAYDPEEDTEIIFSGDCMNDMEPYVLESIVQDFYICPILNDDVDLDIVIYI